MLKISEISKKHMIIIVVIILGISGWIYPFTSDMDGSGGFEEKNIIIKVSEDKVKGGLLYKPEGEGPFPLVYFGAGSGADPVQYSYYGESFAKNGFITFIHGPTRRAADFPSKIHWEIRNDRDFLFERNLKEDLEVISQLKKRKDVDSNRIIVAGHSGGANSAYRIAIEEKDISSVIAIAGRFPPDDIDELDTNLLLATGKEDSIVPPETLKEIAYNVTGKKLVSGEVSGSFEQNNATKIYVSESSGHLTEAIDEKLIEESVEWAAASVGEDVTTEIDTKSFKTMTIQLISGLTVLIGVLLLAGGLRERFDLLDRYELFIPISAFIILFLVLITTVSMQFINLDPVGYRWLHYLLIVMIGILTSFSFYKLSKKYRFERKYKMLTFDLSFFLLTGSIFILVSTQLVLFQLVTIVVLGCLLMLSLMGISLVMLKTGMNLRQRLVFDLLAATWLLPVLVPVYPI